MSLKSIIIKNEVTLSLWAIILVSLALRLYRLDYQSLWVDEIASMNGADPDKSWMGVVRYSVGDQPPAFFLLLHAWFKLFPFSDFYGRLLAVMIGIGGIFAIFFLGKEVKDSRTGLTAAAITSFSYIHILFSQDVRFYTLVFLSCTLSYLFFIRAVKASNTRDFVLYTFSTTVLLYSHYFGLVVMVTQGILFLLLLIFYKPKKKFIFFSMISAIAVVAMIGPWIPILFSDAGTKTFWLQAETFYFPIKYFYVYFKDILSCLVFGTLLIIYIVNLLKTLKTRQPLNPVDVILAGSVALSFLIPIIYSIIQTPLIHLRYLTIALPCIIIMISNGFRTLKPLISKALLVATCCTALFSLTVIERYYTKPQKEDWKGMIGNVMKKSSSTDVFISPQAWYCNYYFKSLHSPIRVALPQQFSLENQKPPGVWWLDGFDVSLNPHPMEVQLINNGYSLKEKDSLYRARSYYYQRD